MPKFKMGEDKLTCPYDSSHVIDVLRMPRHLLRCRKNHPFVDMTVCPYNGAHEVPPPELRYHMEHCPDKTLLERDMLLDFRQTRRKGYTELPSTRYNKLETEDDDDELWEEDQSDDNFKSQRNRIRSRLRDENTSRLRLPKRGGTAAQLASSLQALEISDNQYQSNNGDSTRTPLQDPQNGIAQPDLNLVNYEEKYSNANNNQNTEESSSSLRTLSYTAFGSNASLVSKGAGNIVNNTSAANKICTINNTPVPCDIASSRAGPISHTPALRGLGQLQSASKSHALMLGTNGRGRALPSFFLKSSMGNKVADRETLADYSAAAAQSKRIMHLARSLGRGRLHACLAMRLV